MSVLRRAFGIAVAGVAFVSTPVAAQPARQSLLATDFSARLLAAHNGARRAVGLSPFAWDAGLAAGATSHAAFLAATGQIAHSNRKARPGIGENLWSGPRGRYNVEGMVGLWLAERRNFTPGIFPANSRTGNWMHIAHYSQIVWPTTTRVGCALASGRSQEVLVCRYSPKGNIDGRPVPFLAP